MLEKTTTLYSPSDMYDKEILENQEMLKNKLLCTFVHLDDLENFIQDITSRHSILYGKIFVLAIKDSEELACTYNLEEPNIDTLPDNTILVHRKKISNSLYTINALNELIKSLNGGVVDTGFRVDWKHYRNTILLTTQGELKFLRTTIHKIINV